MITTLFCVAMVTANGQSLDNFTYYQNRGTYEIGQYTINRGVEHNSWMWYPQAAIESVHCFVFCMGTGALPEDYAKTGEHLASHGFAAIYVPMRPWDVSEGLKYCRDGKIVKDVPELEGHVDASRMGVGGHSGGKKMKS